MSFLWSLHKLSLPPPHKMVRCLREDWGDNMPLMSSKARTEGTVRYGCKPSLL